ncbi:General stress protein 69 [Stieleria neptunia]|uniref:General stress protein 69 n=1 Tax=Stieleria neptunia TaxID=2527979 RepID=A0A518HWX0_9BACT|nr:aldo/keto reductase [Stieleria neptunia]QDV45356.1 General stress protein 69 [Stieleria neptunia]
MPTSKLVLGLWPIAGITTIGVTRDDARATLSAAIDAGITTFDTAYSYGYDGESDRLLGECVRSRRDRFTVMGKVGQRWTEQRKRIVDGSPQQLTLDAEESLQRMGIDSIDTLFLHQPDPNVPLESSAAAMARLQARGICKRVGICNASPEQIQQFAASVPADAIQCPLNLVQRASVVKLIQPAQSAGRDVYVFWTLMKGLLAGKITRDHVFEKGDSRPGYAIFQGETRRRIHDAVDRLKTLGGEIEQSVAQLAVGWAISQPGVTAALVGARREEQIRELVGTRVMTPETLAAVERIVGECDCLA